MHAETQVVRLGPGSTLILRGPAAAKVLEGGVEAYYYRPSPKERLIAKPWKSLPLYSESGALVEVHLGVGGATEIVDGCTIPEDWSDVAIRLGEKFRVMVIGGVDTGKTSLLTYLYNRVVISGGVAVADLDVGQSEICPPTTMGLAMGFKPSPYLSALKSEAVYPYGYTSPSYSLKYSLKTAKELAAAVERLDRVLINTDGWIDHESARSYKAQLIRAFMPSHVVFIGVNEHGEMWEASKEMGAAVIDIREPKLVLRRDQDARRQIREFNYTKYLRGAKLVSTPRRWLKATPLLSQSLPIEDYLNTVIKELEDASVEKAPLIEGLDMSEAGLGILSYINSQSKRADSLGLFMGMNAKGLARIYTPYEGPIQELEVGTLVLSTSFKEISIYRPPTE